MSGNPEPSLTRNDSKRRHIRKDADRTYARAISLYSARPYFAALEAPDAWRRLNCRDEPLSSPPSRSNAPKLARSELLTNEFGEVAVQPAR